MMRTVYTITLFLCFMSPVFGASAAETGSLRLAQHYSVTGTNADGSRYSGVADVDIISHTTFSIVWHIGSGTQNGFGMRMNNTLSATYLLNGQPGLVIYRAQGDGRFTGTWAIRGESGYGTESLSPRD